MHPFFRYLAAAAVIVAATAATTVVGAHQAIATAVAQKNQNQNDPAEVTATETVIIAHTKYLREFFRGDLPLIPRYSAGAKRF